MAGGRRRPDVEASDLEVGGKQSLQSLLKLLESLSEFAEEKGEVDEIEGAGPTAVQSRRSELFKDGKSIKSCV